MKARWQKPKVKNIVHVDILKFINDGYVIIRKQDGWLDIASVKDLRVLDGEQNDK